MDGRMEIDGSLVQSEEEFVISTVQFVRSSLYKWFDIINKFGLETSDKRKWQNELKAEIESCVDECLSMAEEKQIILNNKIACLLEESQRMCKLLSIKMPNFVATKEGMYKDESILIEKIKGWQDDVNRRMVEIDQVKARRDAICKMLGRKAFFIQESPLPTLEDLVAYKDRIEDLEHEAKKRISKFVELQRDITSLATEIRFKPCLDFHRCVLHCSDPNAFEPSDENMQRVNEFHQDLEAQRETIEEELTKLRESLQNLWKILDEDVKYCNDFIRDNIGLKIDMLDAFRREVKRCEDIRKANLQTFIVKLRVQLNNLWDEAYISQARREHFTPHLEDDFYTEDLLTIHDNQITQVKAHLKKNQQIYALLKQRDALYQRMRELDERANDPARFKNRGGQLLQEEKQRKAVTKKIPTIEEQLLNLALIYEEDNGHKFMHWDETIEDMIAKARDNIEQEKKEQMSARKLKRERTPSTNKRFKSPSNAQLASRNLITPHNLQTPTKTSKLIWTAPAKRAHTERRSISKAKIRRSHGRQQQIRRSLEKQQRIAAMRAKICNAQQAIGNETEYSRFENGIAEKTNTARSTLSLHSTQSEYVTPEICIETPRTVDRRLKPAMPKARLNF